VGTFSREHPTFPSKERVGHERNDLDYMANAIQAKPGGKWPDLNEATIESSRAAETKKGRRRAKTKTDGPITKRGNSYRKKLGRDLTHTN